jgi:hypothetical protein
VRVIRLARYATAHLETDRCRDGAPERRRLIRAMTITDKRQRRLWRKGEAMKEMVAFALFIFGGGAAANDPTLVAQIGRAGCVLLLLIGW